MLWAPGATKRFRLEQIRSMAKSTLFYHNLYPNSYKSDLNWLRKKYIKEGGFDFNKNKDNI